MCLDSSHHLVEVCLDKAQPTPQALLVVVSLEVWEENRAKRLQTRTHSAPLQPLEGLGSLLRQVATACLGIVVQKPLDLDSPPLASRNPVGPSALVEGALRRRDLAPLLPQQNQVVSAVVLFSGAPPPSAALLRSAVQQRLGRAPHSAAAWAPRPVKCSERERQLPTWEDLASPRLPAPRPSEL